MIASHFRCSLTTLLGMIVAGAPLQLRYTCWCGLGSKALQAQLVRHTIHLLIQHVRNLCLSYSLSVATLQQLTFHERGTKTVKQNIILYFFMRWSSYGIESRYSKVFALHRNYVTVASAYYTFYRGVRHFIVTLSTFEHHSWFTVKLHRVSMSYVIIDVDWTITSTCYNGYLWSLIIFFSTAKSP